MTARNINYITTNTLKFNIAQNYFENLDAYELKQYAIDIPEIQDESSEEIARQAAVLAAERIGEPCIKVDVSFHINALGGFPGPFVKYVNHWLSEEDILRMLDDTSDRTAYFLDAAAIGFPDGTTSVYTKKHPGVIADRGAYTPSHWPANSLFIPDGHTTPLGSMSEAAQEAYWGDGSWPEIVKRFSRLGNDSDG